MQALLKVILVLFYASHHAHSMVMHLSPPNGTVVARSIGALNSATFECSVFAENSSGVEVQIGTAWSFKEFGRDEEVQILPSMFEGVLELGGTDRPSNSRLAEYTFMNMLTILNFTEDLDKMVLNCLGQGGQKLGQFYLRAYRSPQLATGEQVEVVEGTRVHSVDLRRGPEAFPFPAAYQWTRNEARIANSSRLSLTYPIITFHNISRTQSGVYALTASSHQINDSSEVIGRGSGSFRLNVLYGPDIVWGPTEVAGVQSSSTTLVCGTNLDSNPPATVNWLDNNGAVVNSSSGRFRLTQSASVISLVVRGLVRSDAGTWTCEVVVEGVQRPKHFISLTVVEPASEPQNLRVIEVGPTWAYISWEPPESPGFPPSSAKQYIVTATLRSGNQSSRRQFPPTSNLSANATELLPNSVYEIAVETETVVSEATARSRPSEVQQALTTTTVPEIDCLATPLSTNGTIRVSWRFVHTGGLNLTDVAVLYSLDTPLLQFQQLANGQLQVDGPPDPTSFSVSELPAGSRYVFMVASANDLGNSSTICPPTAHTTGIAQAPVLLEAISLAGEVTITVATNESGTEPPNFFRFSVKAKRVGTSIERYFSFEERDYVDGSSIQLQLSGFSQLEEGDTYLITVSCVNAFGTSDESNQLPVVIRFDPDGTMTALVAGLGGVGTLIVILILGLWFIACSVYYSKKYEKQKRRYSPARHNGSLPHIVTPTTASMTNGDAGHKPGLMMAYPPSLHTSTPLTSDSLDSLDKKTPTHFSITPTSQIKTEQNLYDTILPANISLPPPSPSTLISGYDNHRLKTSSDFLSQDVPPLCSQQEEKRLSSSVPDTLDLDLPISGLESVAKDQTQDVKRRSWSVPDSLDLDLPLMGLEPISINRDIMELEESYRLVASGKLVRKWNGNGNMIGSGNHHVVCGRNQIRTMQPHCEVSTEV